MFKMSLKLVLLLSVAASDLVLVVAFDKLISKGKWYVDKTEKCPNNEQYEYQVDLRKSKVNRTHDGFSGELEIFEDITEDGFGFALETCKKMDGGCKTMHKYSDDSVCRITKKYAPKNFEIALINIGAEPECPVPKGFYKMDNFVFDNSEMPDEGLVGSYEATIWFTREPEKEKISCFILHVTFVADDEEDLEDVDDLLN